MARTLKMGKSVVFAGLALLGCVKDQNFDSLGPSCNTDWIVNATFAQVKGLYHDKTVQIQQDWVIEGHVVSSDEAGNFFGTLYFQDRPTDPTEGFKIEIDMSDSHLLFPVGGKILVRVKGLYLGKSKGVFKLGGVFTSFGSESVGRLPVSAVGEHIVVSCGGKAIIEPTVLDMEDLSENLTNTLVRLVNMEILEKELGLAFASGDRETDRTLIDCNDRRMILRNSGFSDFHSERLPEGNGSISGVLTRENDRYYLIVRNLEDIGFNGERCEELIDEFTSTSLFISELADPNNNSAARFVEFYNADRAPLSLKGWTLRRYTNANMEPSSTIDLSGLTIQAESTLVISPNALEFEAVYGFAPDLGVGTNSPADSNGDDNLELVDPFGTVIDIFGKVGEDGSGTNHEFEDGRAVRNPGIARANDTYTFSEWTIYNDSGKSGTLEQPQNAPEDFTPGRHH